MAPRCRMAGPRGRDPTSQEPGAALVRPGLEAMHQTHMDKHPKDCRELLQVLPWDWVAVGWGRVGCRFV